MKTFEQFRRELETDMMHALNAGQKPTRIGVSGECRCPLGIRTHVKWPGYDQAAEAWGIRAAHAREFIAGFDSYREHDDYFDGDLGVANTPFFRLGRLYRQRFVEGR